MFYKEIALYHEGHHHDHDHVHTDCGCGCHTHEEEMSKDEKTLNIIRKKLYNIENYKIKFIDSGNYHYISYLILEKIKKPFVLVLFDHHTDMQPSYFEELMSCGCWVKKTLDDNEYIEKVVLIGNKEELINSVEEKYKSKIICFSEE